MQLQIVLARPRTCASGGAQNQAWNGCGRRQWGGSGLGNTSGAFRKIPRSLACPGANHRPQLSGVGLLSLPKHAGQQVAESVYLDYGLPPKVRSEQQIDARVEAFGE